MNRTTLATLTAVAAITTIAGCSSTPGADGTTSPPADTTESVTAPADTTPPVTDVTIVDPTTTAPAAANWPGVAVAVDGGDLPAAITDRQVGVYGATITGDQIVADYGVNGLPYPDGDGVIVIAHQQTVSNITERGASRFDSVTYAFVDQRTDDEIIAAFATATGMDVTVGATTAVDDGTCTDAAEHSEGLIKFIACTRNDGTHTIQIVRDRYVDGPTTVPGLVTDQIEVNAAVANGADASLYQWAIIRDPTYPAGHAISIDYNTTAPVTIEALAALLPGWDEEPDAGYGPGFSSNGSYWYITDTGILYTAPAPEFEP